VRDSGECLLLPPSCIGLSLVLTVRISIRPQEVGRHKPSLPRVPQDAVDRAARRVAAEEKKKKKDAEKTRARERMRARDALEKLHRRQEREGLPREPSPETPDDDDDDEDDDEEDDMAARLQPWLEVRPGAVKPAPEWADAVSPWSRDTEVPTRGEGADREGT
jgi:hypothetical protein